MEDLIDRIRLIDRVLFPDRPLPIIPFQTKPLPGKPQLSIVVTSDGKSDHYLVRLGGLEDYCRGICQARYHDMLDRSDHLYGTKQIVPYSWEDCLTGIAIHEVRHRVQYHLGIELVESRHLSQIKRCEFWNKKQSEFFDTVDLGEDTAREFDALFLEAYGAYEFRRGRLRQAERVRSLLLMTPQEFLRIEAERAAH